MQMAILALQAPSTKVKIKSCKKSSSRKQTDGKIQKKKLIIAIHKLWNSRQSQGMILTKIKMSWNKW